MNRTLIVAGIWITAITGVLAFFAHQSYSDTVVQWDGGFPAGEFHLSLRDGAGKPVEGASFRVYEGGSRNLAFEYPIENHLAGKTLESDSKGEIVLLRTNGDCQFGGRSWRLFWVIPMGASAPKYDCEVTADRLKSLRFSIWDLFESPESGELKMVMIGGNEFKLRVHDYSITMNR
ncbi:MAG TPA: hypothetical protein VHR72_12075 [Gemmataceae bacterium]|jgi:hypothetical protein|nr:hypothetical protein [Gemmataceae bacterium]